MDKRLFILGSINTDLVISTRVMPQKGETVTGDNFFIARGGKGANQAVAAARNGAKVLFCGAVGEDLFGNESLESFKKDKVNYAYVKRVNDAPSGVAVITLNNNDNRIILNPGANYSINKEDVDLFLQKANKGDFFLTQNEIPLDIVGYALKKAKEIGLTTVLNPAPADKRLKEFLEYVDILTPNETEWDILGKVMPANNGVSTVIVTLGSKGYRIIDRNKDEVFPCTKVEAVDTTAAGDTFCGAMIAKLLEGKNIYESAKYGSLAASIACTRKGAQPSIPFSKELEKIEPNVL